MTPIFENPVTTQWNGNMKTVLISIEQISANVPKTNRNRIVWSIRISFLVGAALIVAMLISIFLGGVWYGLIFIPPMIGAYGLFVSSGMQLNQIDGQCVEATASAKKYHKIDVHPTQTQYSYL